MIFSPTSLICGIVAARFVPIRSGLAYVANNGRPYAGAAFLSASFSSPARQPWPTTGKNWYTTAMKIIVGLGNPGDKYKNNRHNVGFLAVNFLDGQLGTGDGQWEDKFQSGIREIASWDEKVILMKPRTFMNDSGKAVAEIVNFYKLNPAADIIVLHDEVDLPFGTIRATKSSSSAGQNGVQSIIDELGTQNFHRIRIGVETRESRAQMDTRDFVLQNFSPDELKKLQAETFPKVKEEIEKFLV